MKIRKLSLGEMHKCYSVCPLQVRGKRCLLFGSEAGLPWRLYSLETMKYREIEGSCGGTMSFVPIPGKEGEFLAVQRFFSTVQSDQAELVWANVNNEQPEITVLARLPHLHRFDVLPSSDGMVLVAATLCSSKASKEDWSDPGCVYIARLPDQPEPVRFQKLLEGLTKNHGYFRWKDGETEKAVIGTEQGAVSICPPQEPGDGWKVEILWDQPVSDLVIQDLDGDGRKELSMIAPFHGDRFSIYQEEGDQYREIWSKKGCFAFGHVIAAADFEGKPILIGGCRGGDKDLFLVQATKGSGRFQEVLVDQGMGPANVAVWNEPGCLVIAAANRQAGEAALYYLTNDW